MNWSDNIPEQGVLCVSTISNSLHLITRADKEWAYTVSGCPRVIKQLRPLTPQEWWQFAPWQSMDTAPMDGTEVLLKNEKHQIEACCFYGDWCYGENYTDFLNPIAWLPLPECNP
ncbi:MAG: hypothetical protein ACXV9R_10320 [Methylobacter sp.]